MLPENAFNHLPVSDSPGYADAIMHAADGGLPRAMEQVGRLQLGAGNAGSAEAWFARAIAANPADTRALVSLAALYLEQGEEGLADQMAEVADGLMPVNPVVQRRLGFYWLQRRDLPRALAHLSSALYGDSRYRDELFPLMLAVAREPKARMALADLALTPPAWWLWFFYYAIQTEESVDTLRELVGLRLLPGAEPLAAKERNAWIARLRREGLTAEAYLIWVNSLSQEQLAHLGYLYNGDFALELSNSGFDWYHRSPAGSGFTVTTAETYGIQGERALRVAFGGERVAFRHLWQPLFLAPGDYRMVGRARMDELQARKGIEWRVACTSGITGLAGRGEPLKGDGDWRSFSFDISIPPGCSGQVLRLQSVGNREVDHEISGVAWFDRLRIERIGAGP